MGKDTGYKFRARFVDLGGVVTYGPYQYSLIAALKDVCPENRETIRTEVEAVNMAESDPRIILL